MGKLGLGCAAIALILIVIVGLSFAGTYNTLNRKNEAVNQQWGQVENVYQRRADLIPNLVATVQGAANFEKSTLDSVIEARSRATSIQASPELVNDPQAFQKFEQAQGQLTSALSRLMVVVERYPELKATQNFRDLQAQLEGTENRITVERMRYNEVAQDFKLPLVPDEHDRRLLLPLQGEGVLPRAGRRRDGTEGELQFRNGNGADDGAGDDALIEARVSRRLAA
jgi:LemA protein